ncbi:MAG: DUF934 domain-containing protein [Sandaracinaceae bacterium]
MTLLSVEGGAAHVVEDDAWTLLPADDVDLAGASVIAPIEALASARARGPARLGVRVEGDADPDELAAQLDGVSLVVVTIPKFTDGRAYSLARLLRDKHGYAGDLRAVGAVLRDQLLYLSRCGFSSFELAASQRVDDALAAFRDFSVTYQPAEDHDVPVWRRRAESKS